MSQNNYELVRDLRDIKLFLTGLSNRISALEARMEISSVQTQPLKASAPVAVAAAPTEEVKTEVTEAKK